MNTQTDSPFGPVIYAYTRSQAVADGVQVEVTKTAQEAGISFPVFLTRTVFDAYVAVPPDVQGQDEAGRLWDIVWMLRFAILRSRSHTDRVPVALYVRNDNQRAKLVKLIAQCGPLDMDDPQPAITVSMPDEDRPPPTPRVTGAAFFMTDATRQILADLDKPRWRQALLKLSRVVVFENRRRLVLIPDRMSAENEQFKLQRQHGAAMIAAKISKNGKGKTGVYMHSVFRISVLGGSYASAKSRSYDTSAASPRSSGHLRCQCGEKSPGQLKIQAESSAPEPCYQSAA